MTATPQPESPYAWWRLVVTLALMTIGGARHVRGRGGAAARCRPSSASARADASLPYTLTMIGFGLGGILMGRLADRFGVMVPVLDRRARPGRGLRRCRPGRQPVAVRLAQGLLIGLLGSSATFAPLVADTSLWFTRRRGIAVAICASGNYLAGAIWPPIVQHFVDSRRLAPAPTSASACSAC